MSFTDSHVHFDSCIADDCVELVLQRAQDAGVLRMVAVGGDADANRRSLAVGQKYPDLICSAVGYDRDLAESDPDLELVRKEAASGAVAIGEIGLDYHYHPESAQAQKRLFSEQLSIAAEQNLPVIVHSREANEDTLALLAEHAEKRPKTQEHVGVLHCFTGTMAFAESLLALGMMISFSGIITFRNADDLRTVVRAIPEDRLLIETDTPYLAPRPYRGKSNEPAYVVEVARQIAELKNCSIEHIADITTDNARRLFG